MRRMLGVVTMARLQQNKCGEYGYARITVQINDARAGIELGLERSGGECCNNWLRKRW